MLKRLQLSVVAVTVATVAAAAFAATPANAAISTQGRAVAVRVDVAGSPQLSRAQSTECFQGIGSLCYLQAINTTNCLTSDFVNTYMSRCGLNGGRWQFAEAAVNAAWLLMAENTQLCLSNFNITAVYTTTCNPADRGQQWQLEFTEGDTVNFVNQGPGGYLVTDFSNTVYLAPTPIHWNVLFHG